MYRIGEEEAREVARVIAARKMFRVAGDNPDHLHEVDRFEEEWARTIGVRHALCLSGGGTAALFAGLVGLGIGPGDEVIVPAYTFMATATAVLLAGAVPVLAEINETMALDPEDVAAKIGPATRAIIPVHMLGIPCDMAALTGLARDKGLKVLEDACQAVGGSFRGKRLGAWGDAGAHSFNDFKIISSGEGGALVTDDLTVYERAAILHDSGTAFRPHAGSFREPIFLGQQMRASEIMGAILRVQRQRLDGILLDLRRVRKEFLAALADVPGLRFAPTNDNDGDCGVAAFFQFDSETAARAFADAPGVGGKLPIDTGKHIYSNWEPILSRRIGHHPDMNPLDHPKNRRLRTEYRPDMCPRTLDITSRSVYVSLNPDWSAETVTARIDACRAAARA